MNFLGFCKEKLSLEKISDLVLSPSCSAVSLFIGTTKENTKQLVTLEYEAFESIGLKSMNKICDELRDRWKNIENVAIYHRLGPVQVKETYMIIAISSPQQTDAIKATEWCVNSVKESLPVWKKETYEDPKPEITETEPKPFENDGIKKPLLEINQKVHTPFVPNHLIQIKTSNEDIENRIQTFMDRKRSEIDATNVREFCSGDRDLEFTCARTDAVLHKRKGSKTHLEVQRVFNAYNHRDQTTSDYMTKFIPKNGVEERLENVECQLSLKTPVPKNVYQRLKAIEDRLLHLESISPEYIMFWDKANLQKKEKKKVFSLEEIDGLIMDTEKAITNAK